VAYVCREFDTPPHTVFEVLSDPDTYPDWLIGAASIRDVDDTWPNVGSRFHHRVGVGPLSLRDYSEVLAIEPPALLRLRVRARPLIAAVVSYHVVGDAGRCVVTMEEEPERRLIGNVVRPVLDPTIHVRNHRSLRRLADVIAARRPQPPG
jgi:uncharacterized protein YndB with AHSA1/START domain